MARDSDGLLKTLATAVGDTPMQILEWGPGNGVNGKVNPSPAARGPLKYRIEGIGVFYITGHQFNTQGIGDWLGKRGRLLVEAGG